MITTGCGQGRDLIIGVTPFGSPNPGLTAALSRAGGLGILDLGRDLARARTALAQTSRWTKEPWGVRVPAGCRLTPDELTAGVTTILLPYGSPWRASRIDGVRILAEVNDPAEAHGALACGVESG